MGLLSRWRKRERKEFDLGWETIASSELAQRPRLMDELTSGRRNGITVTEVLSQDEISRAIEFLSTVDSSDTLERPFGWLLGMPVGFIGGSTDRTPYYDDTDRSQVLYRKAFGFDPHDRVAAVLQPISGGRPLVPPSEDGRCYNPGQIRWWEPGRGGLPAHVGNEFRAQMENGAMNHLVTTTQVSDHLSYFVVLQCAEAGGDLSVYDLTWQENKGRDDWGDAMPDDAWIESVDALQLDLQPGEMVVFGGGWRWHRVDPPEGSTARVTYGGFLAPSADNSEIHFWC